MGNLVSQCYIVRHVRAIDGGAELVSYMKVIFLIRPSQESLAPGEDIMTFSNVFDANKFLKNNCAGVTRVTISREAI